MTQNNLMEGLKGQWKKGLYGIECLSYFISKELFKNCYLDTPGDDLMFIILV